LINADGAAIVAENANGIVPDGHAPGNQLGDGTGILCSHPLGIVLEQNGAGAIAETSRAPKPYPGTPIAGGGNSPAIKPEGGIVGNCYASDLAAGSSSHSSSSS
jgi:hypothetical protein